MKIQSYIRFWRPLPSPPHKITNNILIYLSSYGILAPPPLSLSLRSLSIVESGEAGGGGGRQNPAKDNAPLSVIKMLSIVASGEGGHWGAPKNLQKVMPAPLSVSKIHVVEYCGVRGGGHWGAPKSYKKIASLISVIKIIKYFGIVGGGHLGALRSYKMIMVPLLSANKIVKYCGQKIYCL